MFCSFELSSEDLLCGCFVKVGVVTHLQLHVYGGEALLNLLADPSANYKNKALIPHVDCSMSHSRSSRFSQTVNSVNELKSYGSVNSGSLANCLECRLL